MPTRRTFLIAATAAASRVPDSPAMQRGPAATISRQPEYYHGWPTAALRENGELLVVYSGGREAHVCPFGRVEVIRSRDGGRAWSWPEVIMDSPIDDRDAGIMETPAGSILVTTFTSLAYEQVLQQATGWPADRTERWHAVDRRSTPEQRQALLDTWMLRSTDGGMTWSAPYRVPVNSPHGPAALSDGRLLYAGKRLWSPGSKVGVCESTDDGCSWRWLSDIPARNGDTVEQYHELHAVEADDATIIVHIRNHNRQNAGETLQSESSDGGRTWTVPHSIGIWGLPSHLLRLRDGGVLMTYGYRRAPFGIRAAISRDRGRTWPLSFTLTDDGAGADLGYPSTVELKDGGLVTVWYESLASSPRAVLRKLEWSLEDARPGAGARAGGPPLPW